MTRQSSGPKGKKNPEVPAEGNGPTNRNFKSEEERNADIKKAGFENAINESGEDIVNRQDEDFVTENAAGNSEVAKRYSEEEGDADDAKGTVRTMD